MHTQRFEVYDHTSLGYVRREGRGLCQAVGFDGKLTWKHSLGVLPLTAQKIAVAQVSVEALPICIPI
jgi:hypothetical protein